MNRREFVAGITAAGLAAAQNSRAAGAGGRLKQCVTTGVFGHGMAFEDMCRHAADAGAYGFDLIGPDKWPVLKKYGLVPTMMPPSYGGTIPDGINDPANHARIERGIHEAVDLCAEHKAPNVIVFSGNRMEAIEDIVQAPSETIEPRLTTEVLYRIIARRVTGSNDDLLDFIRTTNSLELVL